MFNGFDFDVSRRKFMPSCIVLCVVSVFIMSNNTIDCIFVTGIAVGVRTVHLFASTFVVWIIWEWSRSVGEFHGIAVACTTRSMVTLFLMPYSSIDNGVRLYAGVVRRLYAALQELLICVGDELMCISIFRRDNWSSIKEDIFTCFENKSLTYPAGMISFVTLLQLSCIGVYFFPKMRMPASKHVERLRWCFVMGVGWCCNVGLEEERTWWVPTKENANEVWFADWWIRLLYAHVSVSAKCISV